MKEQFAHKITNSFMLWFDNFLLSKGEAFSNKTGTFYNADDPFIDSSFEAFSSPYKQFVNDSSIDGAIVKTGIPAFDGLDSYTVNDDDEVHSFDVELNRLAGNPADYTGVTFHKHEGSEEGTGLWFTYESGSAAPNEYYKMRAIQNGGTLWVINRISGASTFTFVNSDTALDARSNYPWGAKWSDKNNGGQFEILSFDNPQDVSGDAISHTDKSFHTHFLDYDNGRIIETGSDLTSSSNITGTFAVKDFNIYFSNETEEDLIVEQKFTVNSRVPNSITSGIAPYDQVVPAIFLSTATIQNEGLSFGGEEATTVRANAVVLAEDSYQLDGVLSIFADSHNEIFYPIPMTGHPVDEYGDLKNGSYNYINLKNKYKNQRPFIVESANTSKLTDKARKSLANDLYVGFIDFDIKIHRFRFS